MFEVSLKVCETRKDIAGEFNAQGWAVMQGYLSGTCLSSYLSSCQPLNYYLSSLSISLSLDFIWIFAIFTLNTYSTCMRLNCSVYVSLVINQLLLASLPNHKLPPPTSMCSTSSAYRHLYLSTSYEFSHKHYLFSL